MTGLPNSNKSGAKGHVLVQGPWASLVEHPERDFRLNFSLKIPIGMVLGAPSFAFLFVDISSLGRYHFLFRLVLIRIEGVDWWSGLKRLRLTV